jgi:hypothetical protein
LGGNAIAVAITTGTGTVAASKTPQAFGAPTSDD